MPELILVTGGTGNLGSKLVQRLRARGCRVRVLSRRQRPAENGVEYLAGDLVAATGLDQALAGVDVVVHCASAAKGDPQATQNLVDAARALPRPPHLVYISVVGANGISFGYFQDKLKSETIVIESGLPWTIQRSTQFFEYVLGGARSLTRFPIVPVPKDFKVQAIDVSEVADRLVELAVEQPAGRVADIGGPEVSTWEEMVRQYLRATHKRRLVVPVVLPGIRAIREGGLLLSGQPARSPQQPERLTWEQFVVRSTLS